MPAIRFFVGFTRRCALIAREQRIRVNRQIRIPEIRVIDENGEQLGVMATSEALAAAEERGLDLVEISPTARPPVCRMMDYGKYKYEQSKKLKESKKKQHVIQIKEIKLRPKTEEHDYQFKKRHAEDFLKKHHKVKFTVIFRGRELDHKDTGFRMLKRVEEDLAHVGEVERPARFEGRLMIMFMKPLSGKSETKKKAAPVEEKEKAEEIPEAPVQEPEGPAQQADQEPEKTEQPAANLEQPAEKTEQQTETNEQEPEEPEQPDKKED